MKTLASVALVALLITLGSLAAARAQEARAAGATAGAAHEGDAAEIGAKLSNPVSDVWALFTEFDLYFSDGDVNEGDPEVGGRMIFQPVLPFPLYGSGEKKWQLITRPIIPILFSQPIPDGFDDFEHKGGGSLTFSCRCCSRLPPVDGCSARGHPGCFPLPPTTRSGVSSGASVRARWLGT